MRNIKLSLSLFVVLLSSFAANAHGPFHSHGHSHEETEAPKGLIGTAAYAAGTMFNVAEFMGHLKVINDFRKEGVKSLAELSLLGWNLAEIYGHGLNTYNYGAELVLDSKDQEKYRYSPTSLIAVNAATMGFQIYQFAKYYNKPRSAQNVALLVQTFADFLFHGWDFYYSASNSWQAKK